jgi:hypothetical protein
MIVNRYSGTRIVLLGVWLLLLALPQPARAQDRLFFLHHSTGRNLLAQGNVRDLISTYNASQGTSLTLWDHDYNYVGLNQKDGVKVGWIYNIPDDNTDPIGLHKLWTTANAARDSILQNYDVIAFKSCYPASSIPTPEMLAQYKTWYLAIRNVLDQHPEKVFVVMSQPPRHRLATNVTEADNARAFADWLKSPEFVQGHPNVVPFDLFDLLAAPNVPGNATRNMLRYEYELGHSSDDSHPNATANLAVAPFFVEALFAAAGAGTRAVELTRFEAEREGPQAVVQWTVSQPRNHVGFHVWRESFGSPRIQLSQSLLSGQESYLFIDATPPSGPAEYWLQEETTDGSTIWYGPAPLAAIPVPSALRLNQNHPNPCNPMTTISYSLPKAGRVTLAIHDVRGALVATLVDGEVQAGDYAVVWRGMDNQAIAVPSGMYLARLETATGVRVVKVTMAR